MIERLKKWFLGIGSFFILVGVIYGIVWILTTNDAKASEGKFTVSNQTSGQVENNISVIPYLLPVEDTYSKPRTEKITHVVIHFTSNATNNPLDPYNIQEVYQIFLDNEVSSHYMIGRDGEVYQLVDENRVAYHAGKGKLNSFPDYEDKLNEYSIGIELLAVGTEGEMAAMMNEDVYQSIPSSNIGYTDAQYAALNFLLEDIFHRYDSIVRDRLHVIGHDEYAPERKTDPGSLFDWSRVKLEDQR